MEGTDKEINRIRDYAKASGMSLENGPDAMSIRGQWIKFKNDHEEFTDEQLKKIQTYFTEGIKRDFLNGHVKIDKLLDKLDNFE